MITKSEQENILKENYWDQRTDVGLLIILGRDFLYGIRMARWRDGLPYTALKCKLSFLVVGSRHSLEGFLCTFTKCYRAMTRIFSTYYSNFERNHTRPTD